ncbi:MAG: hypothetical protein R2688_03515 [Fimbriimonadaceae bacterium]
MRLTGQRPGGACILLPEEFGSLFQRWFSYGRVGIDALFFGKCTPIRRMRNERCGDSVAFGSRAGAF